MNTVFRDYEARAIRLTDERLTHILKRPEMTGQELKIQEALGRPDVVIESRQDPSIRLYHKLYEQTRVSQKYMIVVVKILRDDAFVVTAFFTDRTKRGTTIWAR